MRRASFTASLGLAVLVFVAPSVYAQAPVPSDPAAEALARPISPGSVALLLPYSNQPASIERLNQALGDPRPEVRAVAARVAFTTRHASLTAALTAALEKEQHPVAGAEIVRALTLIRGAAADAAVGAALSRFDARATAAWVETLHRTRPGDLWQHLDGLRHAGTIGVALFGAAQADPVAAAEAFASLGSTPSREPAFLAILDHARHVQKLPPWPLVAKGLTTPGTPRRETAFLLLALQANEVPLPAEATDALRGLPTSGELAWIPVYEELMRRRAGAAAPKVPLAALIAKLEPDAVPNDLLFDGLLGQLEKPEVAAFRRIAGPDWKQPWRSPPSPRNQQPAVTPGAPPADTANSSGSLTRMARPMSVALLRDVQALLQCRPMPGHVALLDVQYRPTGQVRSVSRGLGDGSPACMQVASILAALEIAPGHDRPADVRVDRLVIGLRPSDLECERHAPAAEAPPMRPGARIGVPKKTRMVQPNYPDALIGERIQVTVVVESTLSTTGCVADATILRHMHPALDFAALAAVSEWLYEPARVDGRPVPVIMTVTVNFMLQ